MTVAQEEYQLQLQLLTRLGVHEVHLHAGILHRLLEKCVSKRDKTTLLVPLTAAQPSVAP
jgi:hypothetical protein